LIAPALTHLIGFVTNLCFYGRISTAFTSPAHNHLGPFVILVPAAGGILVGIMARFGSKAIRGHGIPEAMERVLEGNSRIPARVTILKPLSAAIAIGTGGPFGAEGPIIATGGAVGSVVGQFLSTTGAERKTLLAAGAAAGMAAIFGSPISATLLAIELLLFEYRARSIIPVGLAAAVAAGMRVKFEGGTAIFPMPDFGPVPLAALALYAVIGIIVGVVSVGVTRAVYWIEDQFERLPIHWMWWPALGAVVIGVVGYFAPHTMGVGYDNIQRLLTGTAPFAMIAALCFLKYLSWSVSLGSGTSGGTLAPLFTIGGALGAMLGGLVLQYFPGSEINVATSALIGMAAMFAGASRAWLTSIVFALETTGQIHGLLPLLGACVAAYFVSFFLMKGSIMTEKIQRRGVKTPDAYEPDILRTVTVRELVVPVKTEPAPFQWINASDDAGLAAEWMGKHNTDRLAVRDDKDGERLIGIITARSLLAFYSRQRQKEHYYQSPASTRRILVQGRKLLRTYKSSKQSE
jgi:H+/Cl- antiporter ClcA